MVFNSITWPEDFEAEPPLTQRISMEVVKVGGGGRAGQEVAEAPSHLFLAG